MNGLHCCTKVHARFSACRHGLEVINSCKVLHSKASILDEVFLQKPGGTSISGDDHLPPAALFCHAGNTRPSTFAVDINS